MTEPGLDYAFLYHRNCSITLVSSPVVVFCMRVLGSIQVPEVWNGILRQELRNCARRDAVRAKRVVGNAGAYLWRYSAAASIHAYTFTEQSCKHEAEVSLGPILSGPSCTIENAWHSTLNRAHSSLPDPKARCRSGKRSLTDIRVCN